MRLAMDAGMRKMAIGMTIIFGTIAMFLWNSAPGLMSDVWHPGSFVPAQSHTISDYKCGVIVNECTERNSRARRTRLQAPSQEL
jgi:hypothetical protein